MSSQFTCLIIDDEPPAIRVLEKFVKMVKELELLASSTKPIEALELIRQRQPDIIFLDIQMPTITGLELSKLIKYDAKIIFTTAYPQFAVEGFELNAVDYLLKPIAFPRFLEAIEKAKKSSTKNKNEQTKQEDYFFIKTDGKNNFSKVQLAQILYLESIKNYVIIHTKNEQLVTYNTLKNLQENLPKNNFIKIHKSFIVAINKIEKTQSYSVFINNKELPLGETYKTAFFEKINAIKL
ncbi:LytR/AlgR family response regulator transcription factor [Haloflavibacter putidus]|uniref:Response regulator transcription factor n=1 Tax=Haloflavibacter putidus TaxID=2576776 RepID=A0A507ZT33_9FLAO|nr:LytTR family DNA-binding domain-containing protein [Haloflavibacter putidus]TQD40559.1 response regulator transcription factor [Haloflavibacter putidus]